MSRLNSRLSKLERQASPVAVDCDSMLVEILGRRDALMYGWRLNRSSMMVKARGAIKEKQIAYLDGKLGFSARASGQNAWKDAYEQRGQLITSGLATAIRSGGEITALRLTPQGEADARALVGSRLRTMRDIEVLTVLNRCIQRKDEMSPWLSAVRGPARYMCEHLVLGFDEPLCGNPSDWDHLTEWTLPLLTAGYLQANSDTVGRLYYSLVYNEQGEQAFSTIELGPISTRTADPKFDELYLNAYQSERASLETLESMNLVIPIPATGTWMEWQTREVRMRNACDYPTVVMKHDFSRSDEYKALADQVLADSQATESERGYAVKLLEVIDQRKRGFTEAKAAFTGEAATNG